MKTKLLKQIRKRVDIFILDNYYYVTDYDNLKIYNYKGGFWYTKTIGYKDLIGALRVKRELILEKARGNLKDFLKKLKFMEEKINKWFLENEGISYKEFCNIYNNGENILKNLSFIEFPDWMVKYFQENAFSDLLKIIPEKLRKFLEKENVLNEYLIRCSKQKDKDYKSLWNNNSKNSIIAAFGWGGLTDWHNLHNKWLRYE